MDLYRVKPKKQLQWPHELTVIPEDLAERLNARGRDSYRVMNRAVRAEAGFVVDMDSPGETFFCRDEGLRMERVPADEIGEALEQIKAQGPITYQPALDWLEEQGIQRVKVRPAEDGAPREALTDDDGQEVEGCELGRMKADELKEVCDRLKLKHGKVAEMRAAIATELDCTQADVVALLPDGQVGIVVEEELEDAEEGEPEAV